MTNATDHPVTNVSRLARVVDGVTYAVAVTAGVALATLAIAYPLGGGANAVKHLLFFFGWAAFAYGIVKLWPRMSELERGEGGDPRSNAVATPADETYFQRRLRTLPVFDHLMLPSRERWSNEKRVFVLGVVALVVSFTLEVVLGVGV